LGYSGYSAFWCKNGHYWTVDCYDLKSYFGKPKKEKCPICGGEEVFENMVNVTNGSFEDGKRIDGFIKPEPEKIYKTTCKNCKRTHICECSVYKIPKKKKKKEVKMKK